MNELKSRVSLTRPLRRSFITTICIVYVQVIIIIYFLVGFSSSASYKMLFSFQMCV